MRRLRLHRSIALLMLVAYCGLFATRCASFGGASENTNYAALKPIGEELPPPPANFVPIRIVLLNFKNSANVSRFDVIPDGDYSDYIANVSPTANQDDSYETETDAPPEESNSLEPAPTKDARSTPGGNSDTEERTESAAASENSRHTEKTPAQTPTGDAEPESIDTGAVAREITETTLFQSGRFEIVPEFQFRAKLNAAIAARKDQTAAIQSAAEALDVEYIVYGALTDFEIRQQQDYWKLPLWAILLAASFLIQDDDLRLFVWYTMLRIALVVPLNSPVWDYGVQWNNLDINVDVAMNLRLVDARSGSVVYSESESVTRVENVRNLNLLVWSSNRRIKITQSNAGRQIRYVAQGLVHDLAASADSGRLRADSGRLRAGDE
ncbi:MAG: hypothetical protein RIF32_13590 [Leptospirales bacterium]